MKLPTPRMLLLGLFALVAVGSASAAPMKTSSPVHAAEVAAPQAPAPANPWPSLASTVAEQPATLLAHDDRYYRDDRWHDRREDWRREQWRKEQWRREQYRREMERRHNWERYHDRARQDRYYDDRRYYRR